MKILSIIGARPQFIKAAIVSKALAKKPNITEIVIHTGQHFDSNMSDIFFQQLDIKKPDYSLNINGGSHGQMTGEMLAKIEEIINQEHPRYVMVYGDTNSTLAGALAASKLNIPVIHVEAGLRSFNMNMPEEINRILTDQISSILFCPSDEAIKNLNNEGFSKNNRNATIIKNGDVMYDIALIMRESAQKPSALADIDDDFILVTCHRQENTDDKNRLENIISALNTLHDNVAPVVLPLHPRAAKMIKEFGLTPKFQILEPVGYLEMLWLLDHCGLVCTDSGGLQKEAFFMEKYCVTLRDQTEWVELINIGANKLAGTKKQNIVTTAKSFYGQPFISTSQPYGEGNAADIIANLLSSEV